MNNKGKFLTGLFTLIVWCLIVGYAIDHCNAGAQDTTETEPPAEVGYA